MGIEEQARELDRGERDEEDEEGSSSQGPQVDAFPEVAERTVCGSSPWVPSMGPDGRGGKGGRQY